MEVTLIQAILIGLVYYLGGKWNTMVNGQYELGFAQAVDIRNHGRIDFGRSGKGMYCWGSD